MLRAPSKKGFIQLNLDWPFELASTDVIRCEVFSSKGNVFKQDNCVEWVTSQWMLVSFALVTVGFYAAGSEWCREIHVVHGFIKVNQSQTTICR